MGGLRRAARDPPVRMGRQFRVFPLSAGRSGALRAHRRGRHLLHLQDGHHQLERPGHGRARRGLAGAVALSRSQAWLFAAEGDGKNFWLFGGIDIPEAGAPPVRFNQALHYDLKQDLWEELPPCPTRPWRPGRWLRSYSGENPLHELCQDGVAARPANPGVQPADTHARRSLRGQVCLDRRPHHRRPGREQDRVSPAAVGVDLHREFRPNSGWRRQSTKQHERQKDIHEGTRRTTKGHEEKNMAHDTLPPSVTGKLRAAVNPERLLQTATALVEVPSPTRNAGAAADRLAAILREDGFEVERPVADWPESPAVVTRFDSGRPGRTLQFDGHLDTVHLPFVPPRCEQGVLHGSGASDMKGGLPLSWRLCGSFGKREPCRAEASC